MVLRTENLLKKWHAATYYSSPRFGIFGLTKALIARLLARLLSELVLFARSAFDIMAWPEKDALPGQHQNSPQCSSVLSSLAWSEPDFINLGGEKNIIKSADEELLHWKLGCLTLSTALLLWWKREYIIQQGYELNCLLESFSQQPSCTISMLQLKSLNHCIYCKNFSCCNLGLVEIVHPADHQRSVYDLSHEQDMRRCREMTYI
jgi:hypothetical protein